MQASYLSVVPCNYLVRSFTTQRLTLLEWQYPAHYIAPQHVHPYDHVMLTLEGEFKTGFDSRIYTPGSVVMQPGGVSQSRWHSDSDSRILYIRCDFSWLTAGMQWEIEEKGLLFEGAEAARISRQIYLEFRKPDDYSSLVLEGLLMQLAAACSRSLNSSARKTPKWMATAEEIIMSRFNEPLTLGGISEEIGVHPVHLAREYKRVRGCTVGERIRQERVRYASEQLTSTPHSLAEIALSAGFADQPHFTGTFKRALGTTPARYRQLALLNGDATYGASQKSC